LLQPTTTVTRASSTTKFTKFTTHTPRSQPTTNSFKFPPLFLFLFFPPHSSLRHSLSPFNPPNPHCDNFCTVNPTQFAMSYAAQAEPRVSEEHAAQHDEKKEHDPEGVPLEEDEDIDALIDDLESEDGHGFEEDDDEAVAGSSARPVPEELLQTDTRTGLTSEQVDARRRKYGLNQMAEEKENLILKFCMFFVGPIQFVMEVR